VTDYVRDEALPGREDILARLASHDRDVVLRMLTLLCPCRNSCYDVMIWAELPDIWRSQWDFEVREAAHHALMTLRERSRVDVRSRELLDRLAGTMGDGVYAPWLRRQLRRVPRERVRYPKVALRDVPTLIEALASGEVGQIRDAIAALCPADGRHPSKKVWRAIREQQRSADGDARAKARAATVKLDEHARRCVRDHE